MSTGASREAPVDNHVDNHMLGTPWVRYPRGDCQQVLRAKTCAWTTNVHMSSTNPDDEQSGNRTLRYPGLGTLTTSNPGRQAIGSWARYLGLGTLATGNPDRQAIGSLA